MEKIRDEELMLKSKITRKVFGIFTFIFRVRRGVLGVSQEHERHIFFAISFVLLL